MKEKEIWKAIPGFEGYEASDLGRIRSLNYRRSGKMKVLKAGFNRGYCWVRLSKDGKQKYFLVHRLVWISFRGPIPKGLQINHLNEDKSDNRLSNLEMVTAKQNINYGTRTERAAKALKGKKFTEEHKAKLSAARKGKKRKPHSEETKVKISAAHKGKKRKPHSEEHKAKISASRKGQKLSEETKAKISASKKGKKRKV